MEIPGFKLGRECTDGEYCSGYNALDISNHKTVNIQVFDTSLVDNQAFSSQFRDVTNKLVGASFGIMTPILQADISNQACYVVSKYFPSPQHLSANPPTLTRKQILKFALQLAQTLDQLHKAGLVHGGIEISSLYFKDPNQLILRPVILQRVIPALLPLTVKPLERVQKQYLAPEASDGLTPATDFYALGVLLYQLTFGSLPVDTTDTQLLKESSSTGENQDFYLFLSHLLVADPDQRIQNLDQFTTALQQCGIDVLESAPNVSKNTDVQHHKTDAGEMASRSFRKWTFLTAGLAAIALTGKLIVLPALDESQQRPEPKDESEIVASVDTTNVEILPVEQPPAATLVKKEQAETSPSVDDLYQEALSQMETNPEAALLNLEVALKQKPGDTASLELKHQIEKELVVRSLINRAEQQLKELKLLEPVNDNAYETYQTLAEKLSSEDERVRSGFTDIAAAYHTLAENLFKEELLDKALEHVDLGLSVMENYSPLLTLRSTINDHKKEQLRKIKLAQLNKQNYLKKQKKLEKQKQQQEEQRLLKEKQATAELKRHQEEQTRKLAQPAGEQKMEPFKQAQIDALLISANDYLNKGRLTLKNVFSAHLNYDELQKLDSSSQRVTQLKEALVNAYVWLADRQTDDKLYKLAIQAIEQGVEMHPQDRKKLQIKSELSFSNF